jgi:nucleotide-binding universal stress UspA family protein
MIALRRILCPVDFSESSKQALDYAVALTSWYESRLSVLHVCAELPVYQLVSAAGPAIAPPIVLRDIDIDAQRVALRRFAASAVATVPTDVLVHQAIEVQSEILSQAAALHADLLIMGTHGRSGLDHLLLGSVTEKVLRKAPCPVLVVPPHAAGPGRATAAPFKRIVCAVDFSDGSRRGLDYALDLAQEADARITMLHAIEFPPVLGDVALSTGVELDRMHAGVAAESLRRLRALVPAEARDYCTVATRVTDGKPHREIRQVAEDEHADLIVMGVQGRGAIDVMVFGSNTHAVIRSAPCPVLVVPAPQESGRRLGEPVPAVGDEHVT